MRWRLPWPRGKGGDIRVSLVSFPICLHFRRLMIGLDVAVSAEYEPDKSNRHEDSARYDQPIWIVSHLSVSASRKPSRTAVHSSSRRGIVKWQIRSTPKGDGVLSVTQSAPDADCYGDESDANP